MSCFNSAPFTNNSNHDVIIKPEDYSDDDQNNIIVPPGSTYYSGVDGVWIEGKGWYKKIGRAHVWTPVTS